MALICRNDKITKYSLAALCFDCLCNIHDCLMDKELLSTSLELNYELFVDGNAVSIENHQTEEAFISLIALPTDSEGAAGTRYVAIVLVPEQQPLFFALEQTNEGSVVQQITPLPSAYQPKLIDIKDKRTNMSLGSKLSFIILETDLQQTVVKRIPQPPTGGEFLNEVIDYINECQDTLLVPYQPYDFALLLDEHTEKYLHHTYYVKHYL